MKRFGHPSAVAVGLYLNAAVLLAILLVLVGRGTGAGSTLALGDTQLPTVTGGAGIYAMPCQFHPSVWGCFILDTNHQTICTYEYRTQEKALVLTAARDFRYDLQLRDYDTYPAWYDMKKQAEQERSGPASPDSSTGAVPSSGQKDPDNSTH